MQLRQRPRTQNSVGENIELAQRSLDEILAALRGFPRNVPAKIAVAGLQTCSRSRRFGQPAYVALTDGIAVLYTSRESLADSSHRFTFSDEGGIHYHQELFNIDCQAVPSSPLNLNGLAEVAINKIASTELIFVTRSIVRDSRAGWALNHITIPVTSC